MSCTQTASYPVRDGTQKMDISTSPQLSIREKRMAFPMAKMHTVRFYSVMLGSLSTTLQDTPNFVSCQQICLLGSVGISYKQMT